MRLFKKTQTPGYIHTPLSWHLHAPYFHPFFPPQPYTNNSITDSMHVVNSYQQIKPCNCTFYLPIILLIINTTWAEARA